MNRNEEQLEKYLEVAWYTSDIIPDLQDIVQNKPEEVTDEQKKWYNKIRRKIGR